LFCFLCNSVEDKLIDQEIKAGAIRWDAWTSGSVTWQVERTLEPGKYHYRLSWLSKVINDSIV